MNMHLSGLLLTAAMLAFGHAHAQVSPASRPLDARERAALFPDTATIERGRALAESSCAACHGYRGISTDERRPHLAGQRTIYLFREMIAYQLGVRGNESMRKAVAFLDEEALLNTAIYYASLTPPFNRETSIAKEEASDRLDEDPLLATKAATAGCGSCHGPVGNSKVPGMPSLTAQHPEYFVTSMKAYQSGARTDSMMQMLVASLDDTTIRNMGLFYALQDPALAVSSVDGDPERGRDTATEACASCHGADGNATGADMPTLAGQDARYLVKAMKAYLSDHRDHGPMRTAMEGLDEQDINDMAAFYAGAQPLARRVRKPLTAAQWVARCDRCHGLAGNSTDPRYSRLAGQNRPYLVDVLNAYASGERSDSVMHKMSAPLTKHMIEIIADYYTSQEPKSVVYFDLPCEQEENQ